MGYLMLVVSDGSRPALVHLTTLDQAKPSVSCCGCSQTHMTGPDAMVEDPVARRGCGHLPELRRHVIRCAQHCSALHSCTPVLGSK